MEGGGAELICDDSEYLCIIRDVSATGVRLRIFHALPPSRTFQLELATGERFEIDVPTFSLDSPEARRTLN